MQNFRNVAATMKTLFPNVNGSLSTLCLSKMNMHLINMRNELFSTVNKIHFSSTQIYLDASKLWPQILTSLYEYVMH